MTARFYTSLSLAIILIFSIFLSIAPLGLHEIHEVSAQDSASNNANLDASDLRVTNSSVSNGYSYQQLLQITFPAGWTGFEVSNEDESNIVTLVRLGGIASLQQLDTPDPTIFLVATKKAAVDKAPGSIPPLMSDRNKDFQCKIESSRLVLISDVFSEESLSKCTRATDSAISSNEMTLHSILTQTTNRWIALIFFGTTESANSYQEDFEITMKTLKVNGAIDQNIAFGRPELHSYKLSWNGSTVQVDLKSSSNVTGFTLDESRNRISFNAEGFPPIQGITEVTIGRILEGPYFVTINGEPSQDFEISNPESPTDTKIQISYSHSQPNEIVITGIRIVSEFPTGDLIGSLTVLMGISVGAVLQRLHYFQRVDKASTQ